MSYAPIGINQKKIAGCFKHKETGAVFEFTDSPWDHGLCGSWAHAQGATHTIFVLNGGTRAAKVKKTVAYIAVDEFDNKAVWEKWPIKMQWTRG